MDKKMSAILMVAVVVVAAGAVAVISFANNTEKKNYHDNGSFDGRLTVFGNANNDDYLDDHDVELVEKYISDPTSVEFEYYDVYINYGESTVKRCFADANADGKIDEVDLKLIKQIVNREKNIQVKYLDVDNVVGACSYPLGTCAVGYKSNYESLLILGAVDSVKYVCNQVGNDGSYSKWYQMFLGDGVKCFGSRFTPDYEVFKDDPPDYFLSGTRKWFDVNMEETVSVLNMDVVRLPFWEDNWSIPAIITLGFLTGHEDAAYDYVAKADAVYATVKDTLKDVAVADRPLVHAGYNSGSISTMHNGIQELVYLAGGKTPYDVGYSNGSIDAEALYVMNPDWIVMDQYYGFLETYTNNSLEDTKAKIVEQLTQTTNKYVQNITHTEAYTKGQVLFFQQGDYMGPSSYIACAYLANHIWPDKFSFDVDALFEDYVSSYHSDWKASDFAGIEYFDLATLNKYVGS